MKRIFLLTVLAGFHFLAFSQSADSLKYEKASYMIPMRDGILLNTVVLSPVNQNSLIPFSSFEHLMVLTLVFWREIV